MEKNNFESFPSLNIDALKREASFWGSRYPQIKRITLHRYLGPKIDTKYVIVWELTRNLPDSLLTLFLNKPRLFTKAFMDVYKNEPDITYRDEWQIELKSSRHRRWPGNVLPEPSVLIYEKLRKTRANLKPIVKPSSNRLSQKHKTAAREKAKILWDSDPNLTIEDLISHNEINSLFDEKTYNEKTIRNWIKDLCPNRRPGRRPSH
jgi:hypothetical protein